MRRFKSVFQIISGCLLLAAGAISTSAHAIPVTIDFNFGTFSSQTSNGLINQYTEDGFIVRTLSPLDDFYSASGSYGGSLAWLKDDDIYGTTNNMIEVVAADGGLFDLLRADIVAGFAGITFTGSNGASITGGGSLNTRTFDDSFMNLSSFVMSIPLDFRVLTIVDNIALNTHSVSVPEPAAWLLLLLGLGAVAATRLRVAYR